MVQTLAIPTVEHSLILVAVAIATGVGILAWRNRPTPGAGPLAAFMASIVLWNLSHLLTHLTPAVADPILSRLLWIGASSTPFLWLAFAVSFSRRRRRLPGRTWALLLAWPVALNAAIWIEFAAGVAGADGLLGIYEALDDEVGLFWGNVVISYLAVGVGTGLLGLFAFRSRSVFRRQAVVVIVALCTVWVASVVSVLELFGQSHFLSLPVGFVASGGLFLWAVAGARLTDLAPIGTEAVLSEMDGAVLVTDAEGRIVRTNPAARELLDLPDPVVGEPVATAVEPELPTVEGGIPDGSPGSDAGDGDPELDEAGTRDGADPAMEDGDRTADDEARDRTADDEVRDRTADDEVRDRTADDEVRDRPTDDEVGNADIVEVGEWIVDVETSTLTDGRDRPVGRVYLCTDVTEQRRRREQLERKNERLDTFASVVSHDLRNPLAVARSQVTLARTTGETDHLDEADRALDRMDGLIDDVLALAREGRDVGDLTYVAVASVAHLSWENVETRDATLRVETDLTVEAARSGLGRLFENLFRNSVEHSSTGDRSGGDPADPDGTAEGDGEGVTVTVGTLTGADGSQRGFYVADDGRGIPPADREAVFETGYSSGDGIGLGLAIVESVADAHGWSVRVTESAAGGARFEFDGVRVVGTDDDGDSGGNDVEGSDHHDRLGTDEGEAVGTGEGEAVGTDDPDAGSTGDWDPGDP